MIEDDVRKLKEKIRSRQLIPRLFPGLYPFDGRGILRITTMFIGLFAWWWFIGYTNEQRCVVFEATTAKRAQDARSLDKDAIKRSCSQTQRRYTIADVLDNYLK